MLGLPLNETVYAEFVSNAQDNYNADSPKNDEDGRFRRCALGANNDAHFVLNPFSLARINKHRVHRLCAQTVYTDKQIKHNSRWAINRRQWHRQRQWRLVFLPTNYSCICVTSTLKERILSCTLNVDYFL